MMRTLLLVVVAVACGSFQLANSMLVGHNQSSDTGTGVAIAAKILRRTRRRDVKPAPFNNKCDASCTESCDGFLGLGGCKFASLKPAYNVFCSASCRQTAFCHRYVLQFPSPFLLSNVNSTDCRLHAYQLRCIATFSDVLLCVCAGDGCNQDCDCAAGT